jgi:hypothetical protein
MAQDTPLADEAVSCSFWLLDLAVSAHFFVWLIFDLLQHFEEVFIRFSIWKLRILRLDIDGINVG